MPLMAMDEVISGAKAGGRGLGAFNVIQLEHAEAIVTGAEAARSPVVLQVSENTVDYHGGLAPLGQACLAIARAAAVPVVVHLDHATRPELVWQAVELGFGSVMFDASAQDYGANVRSTAATVERCHHHNVWVEAELGEVRGKDGVHAPGARTDPAQAVAYVRATGVDALAVAVGSSHAMVTRDARLDEGLIRAISQVIDVPLVLHGSSGVPDDGLTAAVAAGMTKVNIATHLNKLMTQEVRRVLAEQGSTVDPRRYLGAGRAAMALEVARLLRVLGSSEGLGIG
jgi:fructose-bisphosphate aldolase, class II